MNHLKHGTHLFERQIASLQRGIIQIEPTFDAVISLILEMCGKVVVTGVGKSGLIAHKISATLASTGTPSVYLNASEALHGDLGMVSKGDVVLMLSKSGTTIELVKMLPTLEKVQAKTVGILGNPNTRLAQSLDFVLDGSVETEGGMHDLAPMCSTTLALVIGDAIAEALMQARKFQPEDFALFHPAGQLGRNLLLTAADVMHPLPICRRTDSLKAVLVEMTRKNLGAVCVCDAQNRLEGIITDGDVRRWFSQNESLAATAEEIMTKQPVTLAPQMKLAEVMSVLENPKRQIYVAPVVENGICVGVLRMHDVLQA
ncbi:MAG: KpsF/GutQ family sugar-phosphate isomerase [Bacteroidota bacterium]